jgi:hypothetical protein
MIHLTRPQESWGRPGPTTVDVYNVEPEPHQLDPQSYIFFHVSRWQVTDR